MDVPGKPVSPGSADNNNDSTKSNLHGNTRRSSTTDKNEKTTVTTRRSSNSGKNEDKNANISNASMLKENEIKKEVVTDDDETEFETDDDATDEADDRLVIDDNSKQKSSSGTQGTSPNNNNAAKPSTSNHKNSNQASKPMSTRRKSSEPSKPSLDDAKPGPSKMPRRPIKVKIFRKNKSVIIGKSKESEAEPNDVKPSTSMDDTVTKTENVHWIVPFDQGWKREIVFRAVSEPSPKKKPPCDVYYFAPCKTKLRSMPEILNYLRERNIELGPANFTFLKQTIYHPPQEVTRQAASRSTPGSKGSSPAVSKAKSSTPKAKKLASPMSTPLAPGFEAAPTETGVSVVTPAPLFTSADNSGAGDSVIISTKRWRKRKALPPDFISTDMVLSSRGAIKDFPLFPPPPPLHRMFIPPTPPAPAVQAQVPQPSSSTTTATTSKVTTTSSTADASNTLTPVMVVKKRAANISLPKKVEAEPVETPPSTEERPNSTRRSTRVRVLPKDRDWPRPPVLKREVNHISESKTTAKINTHRKNHHSDHKSSKPSAKCLNGLPTETIAKEHCLPHSDSTENSIKITNSSEACILNGAHVMPCLKPMVEFKWTRKRSHCQRIKTDDVVKKKEPVSDHEEKESDLPDVNFNCENLEQVNLRVEDYDSSSSVESDKLFLRKKFVSSRPLLCPDLDNQLYEFVLSRTVEGFDVSNQLLKQKSQEFAVSLGFKNFVSSSRFVEQWKKRMNIVCLGHKNQPNIGHKNQPKVGHFTTSVGTLRSKYGYTDSDIGNIYFTHLSHGNSTPVCSVILSTLATGIKRPAFVILDKKNGTKPKVPPNVKIAISSESRITLELHREWAKQVWGHHKNWKCHRLLILYDTAMHNLAVLEWCLTDYRTDVVQAPSCLTLTWAKDFEVRLSRHYDKFLIQKGACQVPTQQQLIDWISDSWQEVNEEDIVLSHQAFNAIGTTNNTEYFYETDHTYDICHSSGSCFVEVYSESSDEACQES